MKLPNEEVAVGIPADSAWAIISSTENTSVHTDTPPLWSGLQSVEFDPPGELLDVGTWMEMRTAKFGNLIVAQFTEVDHDNFSFTAEIPKGPCGVKGDIGIDVREGKTAFDSLITVRANISGNFIIERFIRKQLPYIRTSVQEIGRAIGEHSRA